MEQETSSGCLRINDRHVVDPVTGIVRNTATGKETRLEPRVIRVLLLLADRPGDLVTRELLIKEIWNDYAGGDEALTQAVSALRKAVDDTGKTLIATVPKKGYVLHAAIDMSKADPTDGTAMAAYFKRRKWRVIALSSLLVIGLVLFFANGSPDAKEKTAVPFDDVEQPAGDDPAHTITTTAPDGTRYKLTAIGDARPQFYVNGRLLSPDEMEKHLPLIRRMTNALQERNAKGH